MEYGSSNDEPLLHSIRIILHFVLGPIDEIDLFEDRVNASHILLVKARCEFEVLAARHAFVEILMFGHDTDERSQMLLFGDYVAIRDATTSGTWQQLATQHANRGRFAGAVVAQKAEDFAGIYCERDVVDRSQTVECTGKILNFYGFHNWS